jgi:hypothetical protein
MRAELRACERVWLDPAAHDEAEILEALGTLLAAYGLGSRTAEAVLTRPGRLHHGWRPPPREGALQMAADVFRLAADLRHD